MAGRQCASGRSALCRLSPFIVAWEAWLCLRRLSLNMYSGWLSSRCVGLRRQVKLGSSQSGRYFRKRRSGLTPSRGSFTAITDSGGTSPAASQRDVNVKPQQYADSGPNHIRQRIHQILWLVGFHARGRSVGRP